jgi:predicted component of type VI protein secretion system
MLTLEVTSGPAAGQSLELGDELVIGREDAGLVIDDPEISRRHARVCPVDGGVMVEDLGSTNGTYVNSQRVTTQPLKPHDVIELGDTRLLVLHPAEAPSLAPEGSTPAPPAGVTTFAEVPPEVAAAAADEVPAAPAEPAEAEPAEAAAPEPLAEPEPAEAAALEPDAAPEPHVAPKPPPPTQAEPEPVAEVEPVPEPDSAPPADEAAPVVEATPVDEPAPIAAPSVPRTIALRLEVDADSGDLTVEVDDPEGPVRFVKRDGGWNIEIP